MFPESEQEEKKARNHHIRKNHSVAPCDYDALDAYKSTVRDETMTMTGHDKADLVSMFTEIAKKKKKIPAVGHYEVDIQQYGDFLQPMHPLLKPKRH